MTDAEATPILFDALQIPVAQVMHDYGQINATITHAELLTDPDRRDRVWRCTFDSQSGATHGAAPKSVVVKHICPDHYAPDDVTHIDTQRFFGEWAGAEFLSRLGDGQHGPRFYGGDRQAGFIVIEDMGQHNSLVQPLLEGNADSATRALIHFAQRLGRMHADAFGREDEYKAIWHRLSPNTPIPGTTNNVKEVKEASEINAILDDFNAALATAFGTLDVQLDGAARDDALAAFVTINAASPFRTFVHNDPCPDNMFYDGNTLRLIDFESARFGHALRDGLYGRIPFPTCWCCNRVASEVADEMERVYRQAFGTACPAALDDALYEAEVTAVTCAWVIEPGLLRDAFEQDHTWGIAGLRARVLTRLETCLAATAKTERWPALRDVYNQIHSKLIQRWPNATHLPLYPAFRRYV